MIVSDAHHSIALEVASTQLTNQVANLMPAVDAEGAHGEMTAVDNCSEVALQPLSTRRSRRSTPRG